MEFEEFKMVKKEKNVKTRVYTRCTYTVSPLSSALSEAIFLNSVFNFSV